jgi:tetratricopeptide (TPR) repeat protein
MGDRKIGINVDGDGNVIRENTIHIDARPKSPDRTGDEPPNNLGQRGVDRDRFFGRDATLAELHNRLENSDRVAVASVAGMGGVGKSELAVQYARQYLTESYRGGAVWLDAARAGLELVNFARVQFFPDVDLAKLGDLPEQLGFIWSHWPADEVPPESVLLVFDDVTDYGSQVAELLPSDKRFRVIVTTRQKIQGIDRLDLNVLGAADALALLRSIVGDERIEAEASTAAEICEWLGYLPLGVELVGYYLQRKPRLSLVEMLERLQDKRLEAKALIDVPDALTAQRGVAAAFELSWEAVGSQEWGVAAQKLAMRLSLLAAAPISWELVAGCWTEVDEVELEDWLDALIALHLVQYAGTGRYRLHPLIREFFSAKLVQRPEATEWRRSFAIVMAGIAKRIPSIVTISKQVELKEAIVHLVAATEYSDLLSDDDCRWPFEGLARFYEAQSLFIEAETYRQQCLDRSETRFGADHPDTAGSLNNLALLYESQGKYESAEPLYQRALDIYERQLGADHPHTAASLNNLAALYYSQGKYESTEPLLQRALDIHERQLGADHPDTAASLNNLAELYRSQGKYESAEPLFQRALDIKERQLGADHPDTAGSLNNLAGLYESQGKYESAEPLFQRALDIHERQLGADHPDTANSLNNLAGLYQSQGKYAAAEPLFLRTLKIWRQSLGDEHPNTQIGFGNFLAFVRQVVADDRAAELSDDPLTQLIVAQQRNTISPNRSQSSIWTIFGKALKTLTSILVLAFWVNFIYRAIKPDIPRPTVAPQESPLNEH